MRKQRAGRGLGRVVAAAVALAMIAVGIGRAWGALVGVVGGLLLLGWASGGLTRRRSAAVGRWLIRRVAGGEAAGKTPGGARAWRDLVKGRGSAGGVSLIEVARAAEAIGIAPRPRLTPTQSARLAGLADEAGFAIEPDARAAARGTYAWGDLVAVYPGRRRSGPPRDPKYLGAAAIFGLGAYVAAADGSVDGAEVDRVARFIEEHFHLGPAETRRLEALKALLTRTPPASARRHGKEIQARLLARDLRKVGPILVGVAAADGVVAPREVVALRAAYRALGLAPADLDALLASVRSTVASPPARPAAGNSPEPAPEAAVAIDPERLRKVLVETEDVARILGEALRDADAEPEASIPVVTPDTPIVTLPVASGEDPRFEGLDPRYRPLAGELLGKAEWSAGDLLAAARRRGLLPSSAVEAINDWSQDRLGDLLLEPLGDDGDGLRVQARLLPNPTATPP